jgi:hypothetical protein
MLLKLHRNSFCFCLCGLKLGAAYCFGSWVSVVSRATQQVDAPRFESRQRQDIFLFYKTFRLALGLTHPPIQQISGLFLGIKQMHCEVNHLSPCSVGIKNEWSCTSAAPLYAFVVCIGTIYLILVRYCLTNFIGLSSSLYLSKVV